MDRYLHLQGRAGRHGGGTRLGLSALVHHSIFERPDCAARIARKILRRVQLDPNNAPTDAAQLEQFQTAQGQLSNALSRLLVVVERYPELKANQNFVGLQAQLEGTENRISVERGNFNTAVQNYNIAVRSFPTNLIAGMLGFAQRPFFTAQQGAERPPPVQFNFGSPAPTPATTGSP